MTGEQLKARRLRYQRVVELVEEGIRMGRYRLGDKLPSFKDLSEEMGLNSRTVRRGMVELAQSGIVEIRPGAGTFIADTRAGGGRKTFRIGLAFPKRLLKLDTHHPAIGAYLAGAYESFSPPDFIIQPLCYEEYEFTRDLGRTVLDEGLCGVVVVAGYLRSEDYQFFRRNNIHVVLCAFGQPDDDWAMTVRLDRTAALRQAVEHLRALGHRRIGFVTLKRTADESTTNRAFVQLAFEHRLGDARDIMIEVNNVGSEVHFEEVNRFFDVSPLPTGVIVLDEFLADVLLDGAEQRGIAVPEMLSVVALQDAKPQGHRIPLTSVCTPADMKRVSQVSCDLIVKRTMGKEVAMQHLSLAPKLTAKASSGPAE